MTDGLAFSIAVYAAAVAIWAGATGVRGRPTPPGLVGAAIVLELALVLQVLLRAGTWVSGDTPSEPPVVVGYLLVSVTLLPLIAGFAGATGPETSRPQMTLALSVACVMVLVVTSRLRVTWG